MRKPPFLPNKATLWAWAMLPLLSRSRLFAGKLLIQDLCALGRCTKVVSRLDPQDSVSRQ